MVIRAIDLQGNGIRLFHYSRESVAPMRPISVSILIRENEWQREDGRSADREHLLMVLADLDRIFIKATYSSRTQEVG